MTTTFSIVKRLVVVVATLNVLVLGLLAVAILIDSADDSSDAATVETELPVTPEATTSLPIEPAESDDDTDNVEDSQAEELPPLAPYPPPYPDPFEPTENEVQPEAKRLGTSVAYAITNYDADATVDDVFGMLPAVSASMVDAMAAEVQIVHHPGMWSRGTVEYAQLGGHLNSRISIFVVIRQEIGAESSGEPERVETRTMEVRLVRTDAGVWALETVASAGGQPIARPAALSPVAAAVVDHELIDLPDTSAWDIYAGFIDQQLLQMMLDMTERTRYSVVVLQTGHAYNVFGTDRVSNHSVGRAVDIYKLESELVVDAHDPSSEVYALSEWVVSRYDIREFGSPWKFPDAVAHTFTNEVHQDHLHIGVFSYPSSSEPPPEPEPAAEQ
jgi:hypothetical protein